MSKKFSKKSAKKILFACESTQVKKLGLSSNFWSGVRNLIVPISFFNFKNVK